MLEPLVHGDARGFFMESYNKTAFDKAVPGGITFVQDNHSRSTRGVLRGLHYQLPPHAQGKLVRVTCGKVFDVAVDMRKRSPRFGQWAGVELTGENHRQVWIPPGFAHGFLVLSDTADFMYKTTDHYSPQSERSVRWNDPAIGISWPLPQDLVPAISAKDAAAPTLPEAETFLE